MIRKEIALPIAAVGLAAAFLIISGLVRLTRGHPWLIRRKLRIGALLLGVNGAAAGCDRGGGVTCYEPMPQNRIDFDAPFETPSGLVLDLAAGSVLTGEILAPTGSAFSFQLTFEETELQRGDLVPLDGAFDESSEAFSLTLDPDHLSARGMLRLYRSAAVDLEPRLMIEQYELTVLGRP
ncbi:hypothetical protein FJ251_15775 [bacterium]|nr:hypothetical protein [bacterium]